MSEGTDANIKPSSAPGSPEPAQGAIADGPPSPAHAEAATIAPWNKLAADLLTGYIFLHVGILALLLVYLIAGRPKEEELIGGVYIDLLSLDVRGLTVWLISPLLLAITFGAMWRVEMDQRRRRLVIGSLLGFALSLLLYVSFIWIHLGDNLWQGSGPPDRDQLYDYVKSFTRGNLAVFAAVVLGILGANLPELLRGRT